MEKEKLATLKSRIDYIDIAKALGICLVIAGHINLYNGFCKVWIYSFHMPLFFILSGMTLSSKNSFDKVFLLKKIQRLLVPYFLWGLIMAVFSWKNIGLFAYGSYATLQGTSANSSLWFLPVLFVASILAEMLKKIKNNALRLCGGGLLLLAGIFLPDFIKYGYPLGSNVAFVAAGFMIFGSDILRSLIERIRHFRGYSIFALMLVAFGLSLISYFNLSDNGYVLMGSAVFGNPFLFFIAAIGGSMFCILLSILISRISLDFLKRALLYIGQNTLVIFVTHKRFLEVLDDISFFATLPAAVALLLIVALTLACTVVVSFLVNYFAPVLNGK